MDISLEEVRGIDMFGGGPSFFSSLGVSTFHGRGLITLGFTLPPPLLIVITMYEQITDV